MMILKAVKVPHSKEQVPDLSKVTHFSFKKCFSKNLIVTSSYSAKKRNACYQLYTSAGQVCKSAIALKVNIFSMANKLNYPFMDSFLFETPLTVM